MCIFHFNPPGLCNYELFIFHFLYFASDPGSRISNCNSRSLELPRNLRAELVAWLWSTDAQIVLFVWFFFRGPRLSNLNFGQQMAVIINGYDIFERELFMPIKIEIEHPKINYTESE